MIDSGRLDSDAEKSDEDYIEGIDDDRPNIVGEEEKRQSYTGSIVTPSDRSKFKRTNQDFANLSDPK